MNSIINSVERKFTDVISVDDYEILTPTGWSSIKHIMQTVPYTIWMIQTNTGKTLSCADDHILITDNKEEVFVKDLQLGSNILTCDGVESIVLIHESLTQANMYDIEVDDDKHLLYTNGFVSHNTTTVASYLLYQTLFQKNYKLAILANKGDTAREILDRIKKMFEEIPWYLKPGVVEWNKGTIELSNGNVIMSAATSSSSIRGKTINCVTGDTIITIQLNNEIKTLSIADLYNMPDLSIIKYDKTGLTQIEIPPTSNIPLTILSEGNIFRSLSGIMVSKSSNIIELYFDDKSHLFVTADHKLLVDNKYIMAKDAKYGDIFITTTGTKMLIGMNSNNVETLVYDPVEVEDVHNFFGNDTLNSNCLYLDEMAFVRNDVDFFASTYPVITSGTSTKVIISSTPMGMNLFYKMWTDAENGRNDFIPKRVHWNEQPGRDEKWKEETIRNIGQARWLQEYECLSGDTTIILSTNGIIKTTTIEELYEQLNSLHPIADTTFKLNYDLQIETPDGFLFFEGVQKVIKPGKITLRLHNGEVLSCSPNHRLKTIVGWKKTRDLQISDEIICKHDNSFIVHIEYEDGKFEFFDIIGVTTGEFFANGVLSHNCEFLGSANTLISSAKLQQLTHRESIIDDAAYKIYYEVVRDHEYVACVDVAEGIGRDYSVICLFDVTEKPFIQVAVYRNNLMPPIIFTEVVYKICKQYNDAYCIVESNGVGRIVADTLYNDFEYENMLTSKEVAGFNELSFSGNVMGLRQTRKTKATGASALKSLIESDTLILTDFDTISELTTFIKTKSSYQAESGKYDDICMTLLIFAWFTHQSYFEETTNQSMREIIKGNYSKMEDAQHLIFGFYNDGIEEENPLLNSRLPYFEIDKPKSKTKSIFNSSDNEW